MDMFEWFGKGKPIYNLDIQLSLEKYSFADEIDPLSAIAVYGHAIVVAKALLTGPMHVTEKGYMLKGNVSGLEQRTAILDIEDNAVSLNKMERILKGRELERHETQPSILTYMKTRHHFNPHRIQAAGNKLYICEVRHGYQVEKQPEKQLQNLP